MIKSAGISSGHEELATISTIWPMRSVTTIDRSRIVIFFDSQEGRVLREGHFRDANRIVRQREIEKPKTQAERAGSISVWRWL